MVSPQTLDASESAVALATDAQTVRLAQALSECRPRPSRSTHYVWVSGTEAAVTRTFFNTNYVSANIGHGESETHRRLALNALFYVSLCGEGQWGKATSYKTLQATFAMMRWQPSFAKTISGQRACSSAGSG